MLQAWGTMRQSRAERARFGTKPAAARTPAAAIFARSVALLLLCVAVQVATAAGPTPVSGSISSNTTWTASESPYVLSGEVQITGGAYLTIQPGVSVRANAGASFTVVDGALSAQGTSDAPISFTAVSEQPGGWGPLKFGAGTVASTLRHVSIRYGHGVMIESSALALSDVAIEYHDGPAITVGLDVSPVGEGLTAIGNALNGILVPAGVIAGQTAWRLKGIPYVVAEGTVEVGAAPFGFAPATAQIPKGRTGHLTLNLPMPAPAGGLPIALSSLTSSIARVDSQVVVPAGARWVDVPVFALAVGDTEITAGHPDLGAARARVTVMPLPPLTLSPSSVSVGVGRTTQVTVQIPAGLAVGDVQVNLSAANLVDVPASVTIPAGTTFARFDVQGRVAGNTSISANADGFNPTSASIRVETLTLLTPQTAFVAPGMSANLKIELNYPAPAGGLAVAIQNNNPAILSAPSSATIAAGGSSVTVALSGLLESTSAAQLTFTAPGYGNSYTSVSVRRITARLGDSQQEAELAKGVASNFAVNLSKPAPPGGVVLNLVAATAGTVDIQPSQVVIPEGQTTATTQVSLTGLVAGRWLLSLVSTANTTGIDGMFGVLVRDSLLQFSESERITVGKNLTREIDLRCYVNGRLCNFDAAQIITLNNSDATAVGVPSQVIMAAHDGFASFQVAGLELTNADAVISASNSFLGSGSVAISISVQTPNLVFRGIGNDISTVGRGNTSFDICLSDDQFQVNTSDTRVDVSIADADPPAIVDGLFLDAEGTMPVDHVTIAAGQSCTTLYSGRSNAPGSYRVGASVSGWGSWKSEPRTVVRGKIFFEDTPIVLGQGLTMPFMRILISPCDTAISTSVTSGDPSKVVVDSSSRDSCYDVASIKGEALTAQPVRVTATMPGFDDATLDVSVVPRQVEFSGLTGVKRLGEGRNGISLRWSGYMGRYMGSSDMTSSHTIHLEVREEAPTDVLPEPAIVDYDGNALAEITIQPESSTSEYAYVAAPTHVGSYRIAALEDGELIGLSDVQYVTSGTVGSDIPSNELDADGSVVAAEGLKRNVPLSLRIEGPAGDADAVLHFRSRSPESVQVPESLTLTPRGGGQYEIDLPVVGLQVTSAPVYIDVYVADDTGPAISFPVMVYAPTLGFDTAAARAVHGSPAPLALFWKVDFPCPPNPPGFTAEDTPDICSLYELPPAADQTFALSIVNAGVPPIVGGFLSDDGSAATTLNFPAAGSISESLFVDVPTAIGSYQIEARLGSGRIWQSDPIVVDVPQLTVVSEYGDVPFSIVAGTNFYGALSLNARVAGVDTPLGSGTPVQIQCADPSICGIDSEAFIPAGASGIPIKLIGGALGSSEIRATAIGLLDAEFPTVNVVSPKLEIYGPYSSVRVGEEQSFQVYARVPGGDYMSGPIDELAVDLSSVIPAVASILPESVVIAPGTAWVEARVKGMRSGTTAVIAHEASLGSSVSNLITVISN